MFLPSMQCAWKVLRPRCHQQAKRVPFDGQPEPGTRAVSISQLGGYAAMRHALIFCNYTDAIRVFSCVFNLIGISWRIGVDDATVEFHLLRLDIIVSRRRTFWRCCFTILYQFTTSSSTFPCPGALEAPSSKSDTQSSEVNPLPDRFVPRCFHRTQKCYVK